MWPRILAPLAAAALALSSAALAQQDGATTAARLDYNSYGQPSNFGTTIDPLAVLSVDLEGAAAPALALSGGIAGSPMFWLIALEPAEIDLGLGGRLLVDPATLVAIPDIVGAGDATQALPMADPSWRGLGLFAQVFVTVPQGSGGGALLTNGLAFRAGALDLKTFPRSGSNALLVHAVEEIGTDTGASLVAAVGLEAPGASLELMRIDHQIDRIRIDLAVIVPTVPSGNTSRAVRHIALPDNAPKRVDVYLADLVGGQSQPAKLIAVLHLEES